MIEFIVANRVGECRVPWFFIPFPSFFIQTHKHPTHGRNHTHFRNKPTNHKNGFGSSWERWIGDQTTVDGGNGGPWKELDHRSSESRGVGLLFLIDLGLLFFSSLLICLLLCWFAFFFVIYAFFFVIHSSWWIRETQVLETCFPYWFLYKSSLWYSICYNEIESKTCEMLVL